MAKLTETPVIDDPHGAWIAACPACGTSFDVAEIGYRRTNAYSYGLRRSMTCPQCSETNGMRIQHVDRNGIPDQPFGYVMHRTLKLHMKIWGAVLLVFGVVIFGVLAFCQVIGVL